MLNVNPQQDQIRISIQSIIQTKGKIKQDWIDILSSIQNSKAKTLAFTSEIINMLKGSNREPFMLLLSLLDYVVNEGPLTLRMQVASKAFITVLLYLLKLEHRDIQNKVLALIKKWALKYEDQKEQLPNFYLTYVALLKQGVCFPNSTVEDDYLVYLEDKPMIQNAELKQQQNQASKSIRVKNINEEANSNNPKPKPQKTEHERNQQQILTQYGDIVLDLNPKNFGLEYSKYIHQLSELLILITLGNDMIDNADLNETLDETLKEVIMKLKSQSDGLANLLGKIRDDQLMMISLAINEDIKKVLFRFRELAYHKKPTGFVSSFKTDYSQYDLNSNSNRANRNKKERDTAQINKVSDDTNAMNINDKDFVYGNRQHNDEEHHRINQSSELKEEDNFNEINHYNNINELYYSQHYQH